VSLFRREHRTDYPTDSLGELYRRRQAPYSTAGVSVDAESALRLSVVWACIDLIATFVSTLPLDEYKRTGEVREELPKPKLFMSPDGELSLTSWLYQVLGSLLTRGNAYGLILDRDREGWPTKIMMVDPTLVQVSQRGTPFGRWEFKLNGKKISRFDSVSGQGDLWHTPAYVRAGSPIGLSPISYAASTIGIGLAAQEFGANWFRDGAIPSALLLNEKPVNRETAKLVKSRWIEAISGNREPTVLGDGWKYEAVQVAPEESQFLATIRASTVDVARYFRVPPSEVGGAIEGDSDTYANQEQRNIALLNMTLNPWIIRLEESLTGLRPRGRYMKFNADSFLRVDLMTRYKAHDLAIRDGWKSPDEIRALEELPPIPGDEGKKYLWPPLRQQLTEEELGTGEEIPGGIDNTPDEEGDASGASQGATAAAG